MSNQDKAVDGVAKKTGKEDNFLLPPIAALGTEKIADEGA